MNACDNRYVVAGGHWLPLLFRRFAIVALGNALTIACGSTGHLVSGGTNGSTSSGTTVGAAGGATTGGTTGQATTGGTSGAATTGGTTTGGGGTTTGGTSGLSPGAPCTHNAECLSDHCGINGTGNCCTAACSTSNATCGATACDHTGACTYPPNTTACGTTSCAGNILTKSDCDGSGHCMANMATACQNHLKCAGNATSCLTSCGTTADCISGFWCSGGACVAVLADGTACTENDSCNSEVCGLAGTGKCCHAACVIGDPTCGATACDANGACIYAPNATACGATSCIGTTFIASACNGSGTCVSDGGVACANNGFCVNASFCCPGFAANGAINVDAVTGNDDAGCCGFGTNTPCQTISRAMALIDLGQAKNVTINATVDGGGGDWSAPETARPIVLGWGVELSAPGVYFLDPNDPTNKAAEIFDIASYSTSDGVGYASIAGAASNPIHVGMNSANPPKQTNDVTTIAVENGNALFIANASVNGGAQTSNSVTLAVKAGATLVLGQDHSGTITGTVHIGNDLGQQLTDGWQGIVCGTEGGLGCTIRDAPLIGQSSVIIQGQENGDIDAEDFAIISLTSLPVIGIPPMAVGFSNGTTGCAQSPKVDLIGVQLNGFVTMTFNNGTMQCMYQEGFRLRTGSNSDGGPTLNVDNSVIQNTDTGIHALAGTATVSNSVIYFNGWGVQQDTDGTNNGTIDLSGAGVGGNTVICSNNIDSAAGSALYGVDVYNTSTAPLNASNVAWDTPGPDYFTCIPTNPPNCTCNNASCTIDAGSNDMDAVEVGDAGITTTGNTQSPFALDAGCN